jgi:hypothetical protein
MMAIGIILLIAKVLVDTPAEELNRETCLLSGCLEPEAIEQTIRRRSR